MVSSLAMLNVERRRQFEELMSVSGWDLLLLYGHSWRKDFFRSLVNFNFFGAHAVAALTRSNELTVAFAHPWDCELVSGQIDARVIWDKEFGGLLRQFMSGKAAIAGREFMEARFVDEATVSATTAIEALRRSKTPEEVDNIRKAAQL